MDVRIEELALADLDRIGEIDRSEKARFVHVPEQGELRRVEVDLAIPNWDIEALERAKNRLAPKLAVGGVLLAAFDGDRLAGVAVLGGELIGARSNQLEMAFLYVSAGHRRRGIARGLMDEVCRRARERGAEQLYIAASDTELAIGFYLGYGCRPAEDVDHAVAAETEPTDIHLTLDL